MVKQGDTLGAAIYRRPYPNPARSGVYMVVGYVRESCVSFAVMLKYQ